ncbi:von Willebrand factor type A domain-containing protein [Candidatus Uabimicrobium sp. HlEnr_7]|uniref:vWA domain-containing protein n=1 Tax=Candidatus Uabimicrobium helgolandensis TaxID=3095367 RepID=UPI003558C9A0
MDLTQKLWLWGLTLFIVVGCSTRSGNVYISDQEVSEATKDGDSYRERMSANAYVKSSVDEYPLVIPDSNNVTINNVGGGDWQDGSMGSATSNESYMVPKISPNNEEYGKIEENSYKDPQQEALSTFSIDVDTASYSNVRRYLSGNQLPPKDSVRVEELINYFSYNYPVPEDRIPFSRTMEVAECPWNSNNWLVQVGIQGFKVPQQEMPPSNLVFLLDVSGSMSSAKKLPLLKTAMGLLTDQLRPEDTISIVVYAGSAGLVLPPTSGRNKDAILQAMSNLQAGGSTNGGQGIQLAYQIAADNFIPNGVNRVILATDGDFNVGISNQNNLWQLIESKRQSNIFLTVLGMGMGNLKDGMMEQLADKGNGTYHYIDTLAEARKVLVHELGSTLFTIAKDVKIQVEFNPTYVGNYRLLGYENRLLAAKDFNDDSKDAGEIGAGHTVTAFYEIVPRNAQFRPSVDPLKYQKQQIVVPQYDYNDEILTLKIRYKSPSSDTSELLTSVLKTSVKSINNTSTSFRFATAVAAFGMVLRDSQYKNNVSMELVRSLAMSALGQDYYGYRREFVDLVNIADTLIKMGR